MRKAKNFCKSCGGCCGPVPVTAKEKEIILLYMKNNNINPEKKSELDCKFLDENKRCSIYPVRPSVCKLFGGYINLRCPNYNGKYKDAVRPKEAPVARLNDLCLTIGLSSDVIVYNDINSAPEKENSPYDYRFKDLRVPKPISPDKGKKGKNCNVTACQLKDSAFYYNRSTRAYYCQECAEEINEVNGQEICVKVSEVGENHGRD